jgi:hypothetical protein
MVQAEPDVVSSGSSSVLSGRISKQPDPTTCRCSYAAGGRFFCADQSVINMSLSRKRCLSAFFLTALLASSVQASDSWVDRQAVGRFEIRSEVALRQSRVLSEFLLTLPQHEADIASALSLKLNHQPIVINVFRSRQSYEQFVARQAPEGLGRRALFVKSEAHGSVHVYLHADVVTDIRHESTHAILHSSLPFLPLWLDEGLAEYFEVAREQRASGNPHLRRAKLDARLILAWRPSLVKLEAVRDQSAMTASNYRESWAWVHFLLHGPDEVRAILTRYLAGIEAHDPPEPLSTQLHKIWSKPEQQLTSHLKSWK